MTILCNIVDAQIAQILADLVQFDTQNPPGNENEIIAYCEEFLTNCGLVTQRVPVTIGRSNLIASWQPQSGNSPQLVFSGHVDTVPIGNLSLWSHPPLNLVGDGRKWFGRGTSDMKGAVALFLCLAQRVSQQATTPKVPFSIILTADEETELQGINVLVRQFPLENVGGVILGEPTRNLPVIGHKGVAWFHLQFHGKAAHASTPERGDNAILKANQFLLCLMDEYQAIQRDFTHPDLGAPTINVGKIAGGVKLNVVPEECEVWIDCRIPPPLDTPAIQSLLQRIADDLGIEVTITPDPGGEPFWLSKDHPLAKMVQEVCQGAKLGVFPAFSEASLYQHDLGLPVVILGPGSLDQAHAVDEYVSVGELNAALSIYERCLNRFGKMV